jgi:hypothetical protein
VQLLLFVLELIQAEVDAALSQELLVRALFAQAAFMEHEDAVSVLDRAETVSDHQRGAPGKQSAQSFADLQFCFGVNARSGLIENQKTRIVRQGAGEINELSLSDRKRRAAFIDAGGSSTRE